MKPMGPIPPSFEGEEGMLLIGGCGAASLIDEAGDTPLFVYDLNIVKAQVARFRAVMPKAVSLHYAMKANSYGPLLERMARLTDGFDIASGGELDLALQAGVSPDRISFAGPGKRNEELEAAISVGVTVNLESEGEADRALALAEKLERLRVWPSASILILIFAVRVCAWAAGPSPSELTQSGRRPWFAM